MKGICICLFVCFTFLSINAQQTIKVSTVFNSEALVLNKTYLVGGKEITFSKLKFYITEIKLLNKHKEVYLEKNSFHLIDFEDEKTLQLNLKTRKNLAFQEISFVLGIDSTTNNEGVKSGDLDPTKGMYWAWQSGYINFKLEGSSELCNTKSNDFLLHLGGFLNGTKCAQKITLPIENAKQTSLELDLNAFIKSINLEEKNQVMSPGKDAIYLSEILAKCFSIK